MKKVLFFLISVSILGCNYSSNSKITTSSKTFNLEGNILNIETDYVYLNKIIESQVYAIDSAKIENYSFSFKGSVNYPERFALTFKNYSALVILVVGNENFSIEIDGNHPNEPTILNSDLNSKLEEYKSGSKQIFRKIDYLFPHFQKARLENNAQRLSEIGLEMQKIELEFANYSHSFIAKNSNSFISSMILRDQLKTSNPDTLQIISSFKLLSEEVKKSPDAVLIATELGISN